MNTLYAYKWITFVFILIAAVARFSDLSVSAKEEDVLSVRHLQGAKTDQVLH